MNSNVEQNLMSFSTAFNNFSLCKANRDRSLNLVKTFKWFCDQLGILDYRFENVPIRVTCDQLQLAIVNMTDPCEDLEALKKITLALYYERFTLFTKPYEYKDINLPLLCI